MIDKELKKSINRLVTHLSVLPVDLNLEPYRGLWNELPYGFLGYLSAIVLTPLDQLGGYGILGLEYQRLRKLVKFLQEDYVPNQQVTA